MDGNEDPPGHFPVPSHSPLQVFPQRNPVPGEQLPWRLIDGASSTQPLRRGRTGSHAGMSSTSRDGVEPEGQPAEPHPENHHPGTASDMNLPSFLTPTPDLPTFNDSSEEKGGVALNSEASKDRLPLQSMDVREQKHFVANESMSSSRPAQEQASFQSFGQPCSSSPNQFCLQQPSVNLNELSSVMLPNDMVWQPQQNLFLHDEQLQPQYLDPRSWQGFCFTSENSNTSFNFQLPGSSASLSSTNAASQPSQAASRHEPNMCPRENNSNSSTNIPSLTSSSSTSQLHSSPVDHSGYFRQPPPSNELRPQEHIAPSDMLDKLREEAHLGGDGGEKVVRDEEDWHRYIDYNADPNQAS